MRNNKIIDTSRNNDIVKPLIENEADINHQDKYGETALIWTSMNGHSDVVKMLINSRADVNHQNKYKYSDLIWAFKYGYIDAQPKPYRQWSKFNE